MSLQQGRECVPEDPQLHIRVDEGGAWRAHTFLPELSGVDLRRIQTPGAGRYAEPIVDHATQRQKALGLYKLVRHSLRDAQS